MSRAVSKESSPENKPGFLLLEIKCSIRKPMPLNTKVECMMPLYVDIET
jgi:hypothetical protein